MIAGIVKIVVAAVLIWVVCKINNHLEGKLNETSGTRTDILFLSAVFSVIGLAIFICCQSYLLLKPLISGMFHI